jgi:5-methylcytosine-specific restriction endonuclease McrA
MKDRTGQKQGRLTILESTNKRGSGRNVIWKCQCSCGKICYIDSVHLNSDGQQSCGCDKTNTHKRAIKTGPESNRWIKDRDKVKINPGRKGQLFDLWRKAIYGADSYTCQACGSKEKVVAHHINGYKDFPEQRFDVLNGITLCNDCHKLFHEWYGTKCITSIQFAEFLTRKV